MHYTNIDINALPQNLLAVYYRALFKTMVYNASGQEFVRERRACLIDISPRYSENLTTVIRSSGDDPTHEIHFHYVAAPHDGNWDYINKILLPRLFKQHRCYALFSQSGHNNLDFAQIRSAFEESREHLSWAYNFYDMSSNMIPPIMPPSNNVNDMEVLLACALCLNMNDPSCINALAQAEVGEGQTWHMGIDLHVGHRNCRRPFFSMNHPQTKDYLSLRSSYLTELTGKTVEQLKEESDKYESGL